MCLAPGMFRKVISSEAIQFHGSKTKLIAVTQLTSTSEQQMQSEQLIPNPLTESVIHYARWIPVPRNLNPKRRISTERMRMKMNRK